MIVRISEAAIYQDLQTGFGIAAKDVRGAHLVMRFSIEARSYLERSLG